MVSSFIFFSLKQNDGMEVDAPKSTQNLAFFNYSYFLNFCMIKNTFRIVSK